MFAAEFQPVPASSQRRSARAAVSLDVSVGEGRDGGDDDRGGLARTLCKVVDISIHGARLQTYSALTKGGTIWLTLPGIGAIAADVMWADDFTAGCQFHRPIDPADYDRLLERHDRR